MYQKKLFGDDGEAKATRGIRVRPRKARGACDQTAGKRPKRAARGVRTEGTEGVLSLAL